MIQLLTVTDVAARLQLHVSTVRKMLSRGDLRATRIGRAVRVSEGDLAEFVRRQQGESTTTIVDVGMITPGQLRALHAKADRADRILERDRGATKRQVMEEAREQFAAPSLTSASQLDELQAIWVLERIDAVADGVS